MSPPPSPVTLGGWVGALGSLGGSTDPINQIRNAKPMLSVPGPPGCSHPDAASNGPVAERPTKKEAGPLLSGLRLRMLPGATYFILYIYTYNRTDTADGVSVGDPPSRNTYF